MNINWRIAIILMILLTTMIISTSCGSKYTGKLTSEDLPFEELVENAELIVIGQVTEIAIEKEGIIELLEETPDYRYSIVTFSVLETIKGEVIPEVVITNPGGISGVNFPTFRLEDRDLLFLIEEQDGLCREANYHIDENNMIREKYPLEEVLEEIKEILARR